MLNLPVRGLAMPELDPTFSGRVSRKSQQCTKNLALPAPPCSAAPSALAWSKRYSRCGPTPQGALATALMPVSDLDELHRAASYFRRCPKTYYLICRSVLNEG